MSSENILNKFIGMSKMLQKHSMDNPELKGVSNPIAKIEQESDFEDYIITQTFDIEDDTDTKEYKESNVTSPINNSHREEAGIVNPYKKGEVLKIKNSGDGNYFISGLVSGLNKIKFKAKINQSELRSFIRDGKPFPNGSYYEINDL